MPQHGCFLAEDVRMGPDSLDQGYEGSTSSPLPKVRTPHHLTGKLPSFPILPSFPRMGLKDRTAGKTQIPAAVKMIFLQQYCIAKFGYWPSKGPGSNCRSATAVTPAQLRIPFQSDKHFVRLRLIGQSAIPAFLEVIHGSYHNIPHVYPPSSLLFVRKCLKFN